MSHLSQRHHQVVLGGQWGEAPAGRQPGGGCAVFMLLVFVMHVHAGFVFVFVCCLGAKGGGEGGQGRTRGKLS